MRISDWSSDVCSSVSPAGLEAGAAHGIVNLAIADIAADSLGQQMHHLEFAMGQFDLRTVPRGAGAGDVEQQAAARRQSIAVVPAARAVRRHRDADALKESGEPITLVDENDNAELQTLSQ